VLYLVVVAIYFVTRFNGQWAESDSANFTIYIRDFVHVGRLIPEGFAIYPNGYLDQAVSAFLLSVSGISVETLQQWAYPLLAAMVVPVAWVTYREFSPSDRGATLATMALLTQPDFLFVILRSSHEKFTRTLMLLCVLLVARTLTKAGPTGRTVMYAAILYGAAYALVSSNYLLANSFFVALATAWAGALVLTRISPRISSWTRPIAERLPYLVAGSFLIVFMFTFYVYPPANHDLLVIRHTWDLVMALVTSGPGQNEDVLAAYNQISLGWINIPTYLVLSAANWILLFTATALWARRGVQWVLRGGRPSSDVALLAWLLYGALVVQGGVAILADASGALGGNLQVRLFPSLSMVGVALLAVELGGWRAPSPIRRPLLALLAAGAFAVSALSVLKATNEPLFSNKWSFYRTGELEAIAWADGHMTGAQTWTEFDERLTAAFWMAIGLPRNGFAFTITPTTGAFVVSDLTRLRSLRTLQALPIEPDALQVYDNGMAQVFHRRPRTPHQP
jgi:hypothetical protein